MLELKCDFQMSVVPFKVITLGGYLNNPTVLLVLKILLKSYFDNYF